MNFSLCSLLNRNILILQVFVFIISIHLFPLTSFAQRTGLAGRVVNDKTGEALPGATVILSKPPDTAMLYGTSTNTRGIFFFENIAPGNYSVKISFVGYEPLTREANYTGKLERPMQYRLTEKASALGEVTISESPVMVVQKGDTSEFNASAFKTHPDASAEDLIRKLPGVTTEGSTVKVHGEEVRKVLVDGKPFFGDDPSATLKNLPAEIIEKIQVFDKLSDQSEFTGFRDGDETKSVNIVTRGDRRNGQFGRIYAGYGSDNRYNAGLVINKFDNSRRFSVIGMTNNVNQQNFAIADLMGIMQGSGRSGRGMGRLGGGMPGTAQRGNTITHALGLNYSDEWGKKVKVSGSYFFNHTRNDVESVSSRTYFTNNGQIYNDTSTSVTRNNNHRANLRLEYEIDSMNTLIFTPSVTVQDNHGLSDASGGYFLPGMAGFLSRSLTHNEDGSFALNFQSDLLYMHKFYKTGRTLSFGINSRIRNQDGEGSYQSTSWFSDTLSTGDRLDQEYASKSRGTTWTGSLSYTEPVGKNGQLMITYRPNHTRTTADKSTFNLDTGAQPSLDTALTNRYVNTYTSHRGGVGFRYNTGKWRFFAGADVQSANLKGDQDFPSQVLLERDFTHFMPSATLNYEIEKSRRLEIRYRTNTNAPSITQLQDVIDISNPLMAKTGNLNLIPAYEHGMSARFNMNNEDKTKNLFTVFSVTLTDDYISNAIYFLKSDTLVSGYLLKKGSQLVVPENLGKYLYLRAFTVLSFPVKKIKSTVNMNAGYNFSRTPARIDGETYHTLNHTLNGSANLNSNISDNLDFSVSYNGSYSIVKNPLQEAQNSNYFTHRAGLKFNYIYKTRLVLNSDVNLTAYVGLPEEYAKNYYTWNAAIGYKILKSRSLEARVSATDLLDQNKNVTRTITEAYIEDARSNILGRYFMFTLTYTLRSWGQSPQSDDKGPGDRMRMQGPPPGMMPPPGGGRPD